MDRTKRQGVDACLAASPVLSTRRFGNIRQTVGLPSAAIGRCPLTCDDERDSAPKSPKSGQSRRFIPSGKMPFDVV